ncbi:MAG: hypothetical protein GX580_02810 [Candidatus Hydrogenedens sp.]|nr:hypothetical protein [Candidatus Hydrogenedentota bacterium]NLF56549.1 hypothetical protein [Candidatus Hydrogenedens sp.]
MTTEQNHASPIPDSALRTPHSAFHEAAATNNVRALIEAFRQERDLYAARLAELQERHDRLRSLCDRLAAANELLMARANQIDILAGALKSLLAWGSPGHPDGGAAGPCAKGWRRPRTAHCACCDAPLARRRRYVGTEGPFCRLCHWVRLEQRRKEAAGRNGQ